MDQLLKMIASGMFFSTIIIIFIVFLHKSNLHRGRGFALIVICLFYLALAVNHMINPVRDLFQQTAAFTGELTVVKEHSGKMVVYIVNEAGQGGMESLMLYAGRKISKENIKPGAIIEVTYFPFSKYIATIDLYGKSTGPANDIANAVYLSWSL